MCAGTDEEKKDIDEGGCGSRVASQGRRSARYGFKIESFHWSLERSNDGGYNQENQ